MERQKLILIGGGGHAKACIDVIHSTEGFDIIGYIDQSPVLDEKFGIPYLGTDSIIEAHITKAKFIITVGQIKSADIRFKLYNTIKSLGGHLATVIAKNAYVSPLAQIKEGTIIMHGAIIQTDVKIGANCIINDGAIIEHDCIVSNHVHVSTGALLNGNVNIADFSFVGSGAIIIQGISIAEETIIGAGAVVVNNVNGKRTIKGNPAK